MSCPGPAELAAIATSDADAAHVAECARCRGVVEEQRALRRLLASAPFVAPDRQHVDRLAAEVIARSDVSMARPRGRRVVAVVIAVAAAAAALAVVMPSRSRGQLARRDLPVVSVTPVEPTPTPRPGPVLVPLPTPPSPTITPVPEPAAVAGGEARFARRTRHGRDELVLRDGAITVDGRDRRPVEITAGDTRVRVGDARVAVEARHGAIVMVTVIAGSAEVSRNGHVQRIEAGLVWEPPAEVERLGAFTVGWTALRAGHLEEAIEAFDRATDPVVAEDAAYWAAVATERLGQSAAARRRFDTFLLRFPASPRVSSARAALDRLDAE